MYVLPMSFAPLVQKDTADQYEASCIISAQSNHQRHVHIQILAFIIAYNKVMY